MNFETMQIPERDLMLESKRPLAMANVVSQPWNSKNDVYPREKGFMQGTIFVALDKPFMASGGHHG